jgi:hypothetical protein
MQGSAALFSLLEHFAYRLYFSRAWIARSGIASVKNDKDALTLFGN